MTYPWKSIHGSYMKIKQDFIVEFKPVLRIYSYSNDEIYQLVKSHGFSECYTYRLSGGSSLLVAKKGGAK